MRYLYEIPNSFVGEFRISRGHSSMPNIREKPKRVASVLEPKIASCFGDCCRLCGRSFKVQKYDKIQHISTGNHLINQTWEINFNCKDDLFPKLKEINKYKVYFFRFLLDQLFGTIQFYSVLRYTVLCLFYCLLFPLNLLA